MYDDDKTNDIYEPPHWPYANEVRPTWLLVIVLLLGLFGSAGAFMWVTLTQTAVPNETGHKILTQEEADRQETDCNSKGRYGHVIFNQLGSPVSVFCDKYPYKIETPTPEQR